jgi:hypothetical protein
MDAEMIKSYEQKAAEKIDKMLHELQKVGFTKQEAFSLLGLAHSIVREEAGR